MRKPFRPFRSRVAGLLSLFLCLGLSGKAFPTAARIAQADSVRFSAFEAKLAEYVAALEGERTGVKMQECDFILSSCTDTALTSFAARYLYSRYLSSPVMNDEAVAIHLFDTWFEPGRASFGDPLLHLQAGAFARLNRPTLVGMPSPASQALDTAGLWRSFPEPERLSLLVFYDPACSKCKLESLLLRGVLENLPDSVDVWAVCLSDDEEAWARFRRLYMDYGPLSARLHHLRSGEGGVLREAWGVLQTPKLFVVGYNGCIWGRRLGVAEAGTLLHALLDLPPLEASGEASAFFDQVFADCTTAEEMLYMAEYLGERCLAEGDLASYRQGLADMFYTLSGGEGALYAEACDSLTDRYLLGERAPRWLWTQQEDTLRLLGAAALVRDLHGRLRRGDRLPALAVRGTLRRSDGRTERLRLRLDRLPGRHCCFARPYEETLLVFYDASCSRCRAQLERVDAYLAAGGRRQVLLVSLEEHDESHRQNPLDSLDLTRLPFICSAAPDGRVRQTYLLLPSAE